MFAYYNEPMKQEQTFALAFCFQEGFIMSRREDMLRRENLKLKKQQRTRQIQHRVFGVILFIAVIVAIFSINTFMIKAKASSEEEVHKYKYYTSVVVGNGETLWEIAKEHSSEEFASLNAYIDEVKSINHLTTDKIYAGEELIVPYYSTEYK